MRILGFSLLLALGACGTDSGDASNTGQDIAVRAPIIIAHRGASGERPEHTIEAYRLAIEQGADFIEPDLVMTRDGVLVARHDRYLSTTTDVANHPEFADRRREQTGTFGTRDDWWVEDFTLAELKTLRARQAFEGRSAEFDGLYEIPTFAETLDLVVMEAAEGRIVGIYPEIKAAEYYANIGLSMADPVLEALDGANIAEAAIPVFIQSFEADILRELDGKSDWPLVQLISGNPKAAITGREPPLEDVATYADGIGPNKMLLWTVGGQPSDYVANAKALGLDVHPWTVRDDRVRSGFETVEDQLGAMFDMGIDGVFTDFPATAVRVRDEINE
ncbi:MAG: glycerophosphodiester phosphodiesterase family protein [Pseudomonadota bacterium]